MTEAAPDPIFGMHFRGCTAEDAQLTRALPDSGEYSGLSQPTCARSIRREFERSARANRQTNSTVLKHFVPVARARHHLKAQSLRDGGIPGLKRETWGTRRNLAWGTGCPSAAKADIRDDPVIAAVNRCATQNP